MNAKRRALYGAVMADYARPGPFGGPMRCRPSNAELAGEEPRKEGAATDGRAIFQTRELAEAAIAAFDKAGAPPQEAYQCGRSRTGHWHIRTTTTHLARTDGGTRA